MVPMPDMSASSFPPYSVLMSVYAGERATFLEESLASLMAQTVTPQEIVLVED